MILPLLIAAAAAASSSPPDAYYQSSPERRTVMEKTYNHWLAAYRAKLLPSMMEDFGEKYLYAPVDQALPPPAPDERRVVFIGDSITDLWNLARFFPGKPYVNRGIGGQVTAQMVLRFHQDVIALQPRVVVILAGINDLTDVLQQESDAGIKANWESMAEIAHAHGIKVVFGSIMPVNNYTDNARDMLKDRDPVRIVALDAWLRAYCAAHGDGYANFYAAVVNKDGLLRAELTRDGIHPLPAGYALLVPIVQRAIDEALAEPAR